ncbi:hypothetical protein C8R45DRAFT_942510 [Mycena sanguinolenta]|nr:hypothetical protein C8R45DRAFT_942510 [Mycena sanguinolenta]
MAEDNYTNDNPVQHYTTLNIKPASAAATNVFSLLIALQQSIPESRETGMYPTCNSLVVSSFQSQAFQHPFKIVANTIETLEKMLPISTSQAFGHNTPQYLLLVQPFVGPKPCTYLSTFEVICEATIKFCEIVDNRITSFNSSWEQDSKASLTRADMRFTRMSNVHIEIEPQALFQDVLQTVLKDSGQSLDKTAPNKFCNRKLPTVYIEAHIELAKFKDCTGVSPPRTLFKVPKRPRNDTLSSSQGGSVLKHSCLVILFCAQQSADAATGIQSFTWPTEGIKSSSMMIDNTPSNKGKSKFVLKVIYNKLLGTPVSIIANHNELIKEATTLGCAKFVLSNFRDEYFEVTDFIIAHEGVHCGQEDSEKSLFAPSPASGIKVSLNMGALSDGEKDELVVNDHVVSSVTWLLERKQGTVDFQKYSGTLEHPRHTDKQGATINAFQHFTYLNSNKSLLLARIFNEGLSCILIFK